MKQIEVSLDLLFMQRLKTITSAPSRIVLVLNPFPSDHRAKCQYIRQHIILGRVKGIKRVSSTYIVQSKNLIVYRKIQSSCNASKNQDPCLRHHLYDNQQILIRLVSYL